MNRKLTSLLLVVLLSVFTVSCNKEEEEATNPEPPKPEEAKKPDPAPQSANNQGNPQVFSSKPKGGPVATLIPPITAKQRRTDISSGRPDPYAPFPAKAEVQRPEPPPVPKKPKPDPKKPVGGAKTGPNSLNRSNNPNNPYNPNNPNNPYNPNNPNAIVPLPPGSPPPPPAPKEAEAVVISGVIQLGGTPVAILTAPGDPGVRHVRQGATIAGGQVMVKSINADSRRPVVILEQYGQEVTKIVGESPTS